MAATVKVENSRESGAGGGGCCSCRRDQLWKVALLIILLLVLVQFGFNIAVYKTHYIANVLNKIYLIGGGGGGNAADNETSRMRELLQKGIFREKHESLITSRDESTHNTSIAASSTSTSTFDKHSHLKASAAAPTKRIITKPTTTNIASVAKSKSITSQSLLPLCPLVPPKLGK